MAKTKTQPKVDELVFDLEPSTPEECAEEYLRLEREMAPLKKRMADMKKKALEGAPADDKTVFGNGIFIQRTTYASTHFMMKEFQQEHQTLYQRYLEDISKERVTIDYVK
jgi:hypothetical protein